MPPPAAATEITARDFALDLVAAYNNAIWPAQVLGAALALAAAVVVLVKPSIFGDVVAKIILDFLWLWVGAMFFIANVAPDFKEAYIIGGAFLLQGTFLLVDTFYGGLEFRPYASRLSLTLGAVLILITAVGHPLLAAALGRGGAHLTLVGTAPGPTAAFTLALFVFSSHKPAPLFYLVPAAWAVIAGVYAAAAWHLLEELVPAAVGAAAVANLLLAPKLAPKHVQGVTA